jgi:tyrosinase
MAVRAAITEADFTRADLRFIGVDHSGASYEGRVFLNNPKANEKTPTTPASGYAGSFYVFGHGRCFGDVGHCDVPTHRRENDLRQPHPLTPKNINVIITDALRRQLKKGQEIHVTVVPIVMASTEKYDMKDVLKFKRFEILTYK